MFRPDPQKDETSQSLLRTISRRGLFSPVSFSIMRFDQDSRREHLVGSAVPPLVKYLKLKS